LAASALILAACAPRPAAGPITVFAAASLTDVLTEIGRAFEAETGRPVRFSFGGSDVLAKQILAGAAADVFVSASLSWLEKLESAGATDGAAVTLAGNRLVVVVPAGRPHPADAAGLDGAAFRLIALAQESVPAGSYAREALARLGRLEVLAPRLVGQKDVRAALRVVAAGEADAGFVYRTDAQVEPKVEVAFEIPAGLHTPITYPAALLRGGSGRAFLEFLRSPGGRSTFARHGFVPAP
jgi:molybdate transport system substrate-binding protein